MLQGLVLRRQHTGVQVEELIKKEIDEDRSLFKFVGRHLEVDAHALAADFSKVEIIGRGCQVDARILKNQERRAERRDDTGQGVLGVGEYAVQAVDAGVRERVPCVLGFFEFLEDVFLQRFPFARSLTKDLTEGFREVFAFEHEKAEPTKKVFGVLAPKLVVLVAARVERGTDRINVAQALRGIVRDVFEWVVAVRDTGFVKRREEVDLLSVLGAKAGSRTWGETYSRSPRFATTTAVGGRAFRLGL